jgi:MFS family permease
LEGFSRAVMVGVVPLTALEALGSKAAVSYVFAGGAVITTAFTLTAGRLEARIQRRWLTTMASGLVLVAALLFMVADGPWFALAEGMRSAEASLFSVCLSLYIMDFIGKRELTGTESRRLMHSGAAWLVGPSVGGWLYSTGHPNAPFIVSAVTTISVVAYFWRLRIHRNPILIAPTTTSHIRSATSLGSSLNATYELRTRSRRPGPRSGRRCSSTVRSTSSKPICRPGWPAAFSRLPARCCSSAPSFATAPIDSGHAKSSSLHSVSWRPA